MAKNLSSLTESRSSTLESKACKVLESSFCTLALPEWIEWAISDSITGTWIVESSKEVTFLSFLPFSRYEVVCLIGVSNLDSLEVVLVRIGLNSNFSGVLDGIARFYFKFGFRTISLITASVGLNSGLNTFWEFMVLNLAWVQGVVVEAEV